MVGFDEAGRGPLAGPVSAAAVILPPDFPLDLLDDSKKLTEKRRLAAETLIREKARWGIAWATPAEIDDINILRASLLAMKRAYLALVTRGSGETRGAGVEAGRGSYPLGEAGGDLSLGPAFGIADGLFYPDFSTEGAGGEAGAGEPSGGGSVAGRRGPDVPGGSRLPGLIPALPGRALVKADALVPAVMAASILAKTARDALMVEFDRRWPGYGYAKHKGYPTKAHREACLRLGPSPIQRKSFRIEA